MELLPVELKIFVLHNIDSLSTLFKFISTSRSIYDAFSIDRVSILSSILQREIGPENANYALDMYNSSVYPMLELERMVRSGWENRPTKAQTPVYLNPKTDAFRAVAKFQGVLARFTDDLCKTASQVNPLIPSNPEALSIDEVTRIHRAFYRFETYCNLFPKRGDEEMLARRDHLPWPFLILLPPWEAEELACVHKYLHTRLDREMKPEPDNGISLQYWFGKNRSHLYKLKESLLSNGMGFLHKLFITGDILKRRSMTRNAAETCDVRGTDFLGYHLRFEQNIGTAALLDESECTAIALQDDSTQGPNAGWLSVHCPHDLFEIINERKREDLRKWGYCFWSASRLRDNRFFEDALDKVEPKSCA